MLVQAHSGKLTPERQCTICNFQWNYYETLRYIQISVAILFLQVPFDLVVAHVDESAACSPSRDASDQRERQIWESVEGSISRDSFVCLPIEDVYLLNSSGSADPKSRLDRRKQVHSLVQVSYSHQQAI